MLLSVFGGKKNIELLKPEINPSNKILYMHVLRFETFVKYSEVLKVIDGIEVKPEKFKGKDRLFE
ncbi:MAG TPA: hypothetical protein DEP72_07970 [Clostridiales bacterium]|nr:MAG: hypothetical protein A2Y18_06585 [Clostridiales bacterium GWD2_32_19]HCC08073.1 hypothetical protein [Clostridiales bacterium]